MKQKIEKITRTSECGCCKENFEEVGERVINECSSWDNFKKNEWCDSCKKKNPQAYFYRSGGHTAD